MAEENPDVKLNSMISEADMARELCDNIESATELKRSYLRNAHRS